MVQAQKPVSGKDFWFTYLKNPDSSSETFVNYTFVSKQFGNETGTLTITYVGTGEQETFTIGKEPNDVVGRGKTWFGTAYVPLNEGTDYHTIHISSTVEIFVFMSTSMFSSPRNHGDASMVMPTESLGHQYYVMSHNEGTNQYLSELDIVATEDSTFVDVIPSVKTRFLQAGQKVTVMLWKGQRYRIQSTSDLTGTYVGLNPERNTSCKPFAVFSGSTQTTVGDATYAGHMFKQLLPVNFWGKEYSITPFIQDAEYLLKILALEDNTEVKVDGVTLAKGLNAAEYVSLNLTGEKKVTSNKPIFIGQYFKGFTHENSEPVDPFMLLPLADGHMSTHYLDTMPAIFQGSELKDKVLTFPSSDWSFNAHESADFRKQLKSFSSDPSVSYSLFQVDNLEQRLIGRGKEGGIFNHYAFSKLSSRVNRGFNANVMYIELDTLSIKAEQMPSDEQAEVFCQGAAVAFEPDFSGKDGLNPRYDTFEWDFGDGSKGSGELVDHVYDRPGTYYVWLKAYDSNAFCTDEDFVSIPIQIRDTSIDSVDGANSVCPNVEGVRYAVSGYDGNTYSWEVSGGIIVSQSNTEIFVNWGDSNANAFVKVTSQNDLNCDGDELLYPVAINPELSPEIPQGAQEVCFNSRIQVYSTNKVFGSLYNWQVENGTVLSGQGTSEVTVEWDGSGNGTIWFTETSTTRTDVCSGDSPKLFVSMLEELIVTPTVTNISCYGESDGSVDLDISGSRSPYSVSWEHGAEGSSLQGLTPGEYKAKVQDDAGCEVEITVSITEPEPLEVDLAVEDVRCNGENNGSVEAQIRGGTSPYRVYLNNSNTDRGNRIEGLRAGNHSLRIIDANNCELIRNFEILEPLPLTAKTTDSPTCPGEGTGTIYVEAEGGTRPYTYRWNTSPPQDVQLISGLTAGKYSVTVTDANGCTFTFPNEEVGEQYPHIFMPNAFSPDGDGMNDTFQAVYDCSSNFRMKVFSRWGGEVIYYSEDINEAWDGTFQGAIVPAGTYTYLVSYWGESNGKPYQEIVRGMVKLIR